MVTIIFIELFFATSFAFNKDNYRGSNIICPLLISFGSFIVIDDYTFLKMLIFLLALISLLHHSQHEFAFNKLSILPITLFKMIVVSESRKSHHLNYNILYLI